MRPLAVVIRHAQRKIIHRCEKCGVERKNKVDHADFEEALSTLALAAQPKTTPEQNQAARRRKPRRSSEDV